MAVLLSVCRCQETWESKIVRAFSLREKDRMRGLENQSFSFSNPLTPTLSLRERGPSGTAVTLQVKNKSASDISALSLKK
jgi:hypothetical protein